MTVFYHQYDLPEDVSFGAEIAVDTEAMGLNNLRDRLCVVQLSAGDGDAHLVHFPEASYGAPRLKALLADESKEKLFHFARFDVAIIKHYLGVECTPLYCTKMASRLARTFTDRHGLRDLCRDLIGVELSKQQQSSDWGAADLTQEQQEYAASDVLHLHELKAKLDAMLVREGRAELARSVMDCIPARAQLDLEGWAELDIFAH